MIIKILEVYLDDRLDSTENQKSEKLVDMRIRGSLIVAAVKTGRNCRGISWSTKINSSNLI